MARPQHLQTAAPWGGPLDESTTPRRVGDVGAITAGSNIIYRRGGAYGSRPGRVATYTSSAFAQYATLPMTGIRWYKSAPSNVTQTVVAQSGATSSRLMYGGNPNATTPTTLTNITTGTSTPTWPVSYAPANDPVTNSDILIICGGGGFCPTVPGYVTLLVNGSTGTYTLTITNASAQVTTISYTCTSADNPFSLAQELTTLLNTSTAVYNGEYPTIAEAVYYTEQNTTAGGGLYALVLIPALTVGQATATVAVTGTSLGFAAAGGSIVGSTATMGTVSSPTGPASWNGSTLTALSNIISSGTMAFTSVPAAASNPPQACVSWHNHVWYWGVAGAANYLFASDINQPQNASFMLENGAYPIGLGDGDPGILACVPLGNTLYVFKRHSIYAVTGYDFQSGEYSFAVQPVVQGQGIPGPGCVATLRNALVFWNGSTFRRLAPGALETEDIGLPIAITQGNVAQPGSAKWVQATGGNFVIQTNLAGPYAIPSQMALNNCAYFIMSQSGAAPTEMIVYDDDASNYLGAYAWSYWTLPSGVTPESFIPFGGGLDSTLTYVEIPQLYEVATSSTNVLTINQLGGSPGVDLGTPVASSFTTGWITCGNPHIQKELHSVFLEVQATPGVTITGTVTPAIYKQTSGIPGTTAAYQPMTISFYTTLTNGVINEQYQVLLGNVEPAMIGNAFQFTFAWSGGATTQCEIVGLTLDYIQEDPQP